MRQNYEIINNGQITPQRLHALLRLVERLEGPSREQLTGLLQPDSLVSDTSASAAVIAAAKNCGLLIEQDGTLTIDPNTVLKGAFDTVDSFRTLMQSRLCGIRDPNEDNYLLNLFAAWYSVQESSVLTKSKSDIFIKFNEDISAREGSGIEEGRLFNATKLNAWLTWAAFLGWGWPFGGLLAPAAQARLRPVLKPLVGQVMAFEAFMEHLANRCPELDGGDLHELCWAASRPAEMRGLRIGLMLSTALRVLHRSGEIILSYERDAEKRWQMHPAEGHLLNEVSHIEIKRIAA
jgi:hypothetical protein